MAITVFFTPSFMYSVYCYAQIYTLLLAGQLCLRCPLCECRQKLRLFATSCCKLWQPPEGRDRHLQITVNQFPQPASWYAFPSCTNPLFIHTPHDFTIFMHSNEFIQLKMNLYKLLETIWQGAEQCAGTSIMSEQCVLLCNFLSVYEHQYPEMCLFTNKHKQGCVHYHDLNCLVTTNTCMEVQHNEYLLVPLQKVTPKLCHKPYSDCTIYSTITSLQAGCHIKNILGNVEHCAASMSKWH